MKISEHFSLEEFHCHDGTEYPKSWIPNRLKNLVNNLEIIRKELGGYPIIINSAYRTSEYNQKIKGSTYSQHILGQAVDIVIKEVPPSTVANEIEKMMRTGKVIKGGLGRYPNFTHYDIRGFIVLWKG